MMAFFATVGMFACGVAVGYIARYWIGLSSDMILYGFLGVIGVVVLVRLFG